MTEAEPYIKVDRSQILGAIQWLLTQQNADGAWKSHYGGPSTCEALYIASALDTAIHAQDYNSIATGDFPVRIKKAIARGLAYSSSSVLALHDAYSNAMRC